MTAPVSNLAQATAWWEMGARFRKGGAELDPSGLLLVAAVAGLFVVALWLMARYLQDDGESPYYGPRRLFLQLCQTHKLGWRESWLLWRLARSQGLKKPAVIFLEPERLNAPHVPASFARFQKQLGRLRRHLFAPGSNGSTLNKRSAACENETERQGDAEHPHGQPLPAGD